MVVSRVSHYSWISTSVPFNTPPPVHPSKKLSFHHSICPDRLVITSCATFEDLRSKGFVQPDAAFAGHSLGEFSALASVADILPNSSLVDVVFTVV
jgi:malonyl CoA-acyl carrier protein transacylase